MRNIHIIASAFANRHDIKVEIGRFQTASWSKTGILRIPERWVIGGEYTEEMVTGIIAHEAAGHGVHTDITVINEAFKNKKKAQMSAVYNIQNIVEDIYIENRMFDSRPTLIPVMVETIRALRETDGFFDFDEDANELSSFVGGLLICGRSRYVIGQDEVLSDLDALYEKRNREWFGPVWDAAMLELAKAKDAQSTEETVAITENILKLIEDPLNSLQDMPELPMENAQTPSEEGEGQESGGEGESEGSQSGQGSGKGKRKPNPSRQSGKAQGSEDGEEGEADDEAAQSGGNGNPDTPEDAGAENGKGTQSEEDADGSGNGEESGDTDTADEGKTETESQSDAGQSRSDEEEGEGETESGTETGADGQEMTPEQLENAEKMAEQLNEGDMDVETELTDMLNEAIEKAVEKAKSGMGYYGAGYDESFEILPRGDKRISKEAEEIALMIGNLSSDLAQYFDANSRSRITLHRSGKRLTDKRLHRVMLNHPEIFERKSEQLKIDTSVLILADKSGSMDSPILKGKDGGVNGMDAVNGLTLGFGKLMDEFGIDFAIYHYDSKASCQKAFDEEWNEEAQKYTDKLSGGTMSGNVMNKTMMELTARKSTRKIVLFITDGDTADYPLLESCFHEAMAMGWSIGNIFLGSSCRNIKQLSESFGFENITCDKLDELNGYVLGQMEKILGYNPLTM